LHDQNNETGTLQDGDADRPNQVARFQELLGVGGVPVGETTSAASEQGVAAAEPSEAMARTGEHRRDEGLAAVVPAQSVAAATERSNVSGRLAGDESDDLFVDPGLWQSEGSAATAALPIEAQPADVQGQAGDMTGAASAKSPEVPSQPEESALMLGGDLVYKTAQARLATILEKAAPKKPDEELAIVASFLLNPPEGFTQGTWDPIATRLYNGFPKKNQKLLVDHFQRRLDDKLQRLLPRTYGAQAGNAKTPSQPTPVPEQASQAPSERHLSPAAINEAMNRIGLPESDQGFMRDALSRTLPTIETFNDERSTNEQRLGAVWNLRNAIMSGNPNQPERGLQVFNQIIAQNLTPELQALLAKADAQALMRNYNPQAPVVAQQPSGRVGA